MRAAALMGTRPAAASVAMPHARTLALAATTPRAQLLAPQWIRRQRLTFRYVLELIVHYVSLL
jgi:hypothetical protein